MTVYDVAAVDTLMMYIYLSPRTIGPLKPDGRPDMAELVFHHRIFCLPNRYRPPPDA